MATLATVDRRSRVGTLERLWWRRSAIVQRLAVWALMLLFLLPIVWAISASLKTRVELYQALPSLLPMSPTLANYLFAFERMPAFIQQFQQQPDRGDRRHDPSSVLRQPGRLRVRAAALPGPRHDLLLDDHADLRAAGGRPDRPVRADVVPRAAEQPVRADPGVHGR